MKATYVIANLLWTALAGLAAWEAWRLDVGTFHVPGPGFLPFYAALILGSLALVSLAQSFKGEDQPAWKFWGSINLTRLAVTLGGLFAYVFLLETLGFLLGTFLVLVLLFRILEPYPWIKVVLYALVTMAITHVFFVVILESRLPKGVLGF